MRELIDNFSISSEFDDIASIDFPSNAVLFYGVSNEERSTISSSLITSHPSLEIIEVEEVSAESIRFTLNSKICDLSLRSGKELNLLANDLNTRIVYIDITGLTHNSWSSLIRAMLSRSSGETYAIYSEPREYRFHDAPLDGQIFDLSEKITGIRPIAGFAQLNRQSSDNFIFMPLLGFEGARFAHIIEETQPSKDFTFPVIGVPGFKHDYPFYTYQGNRLQLEKDDFWENKRYEQANCPASIYSLGIELMNDYKDKSLRIAPIGTKPHALGAVLVKLAFPQKVDLIYDHPIRKTGRTKGKSKTLCYWLNPFK
jgi:hypothetical protein